MRMLYLCTVIEEIIITVTVSVSIPHKVVAVPVYGFIFAYKLVCSCFKISEPEAVTIILGPAVLYIVISAYIILAAVGRHHPLLIIHLSVASDRGYIMAAGVQFIVFAVISVIIIVGYRFSQTVAYRFGHHSEIVPARLSNSACRAFYMPVKQRSAV